MLLKLSPSLDGASLESLDFQKDHPVIPRYSQRIRSTVRFLFEFDAREALKRTDVAEVLHEPGARDVIAALAEELQSAPRLDREGFRAAANRVRQRTGRKGRALFHPIRVALTGESGGPELDLAVPAIDRGADLSGASGVAPITGARERAAAFADAVRDA